MSIHGQQIHKHGFLFQLFTLWSWLPVRITMYQPILLYTTEEHGCSLTTFYVRVEQHEPTLLMIKTSNNEVSPHNCLFFLCNFFFFQFCFFFVPTISMRLFNAPAFFFFQFCLFFILNIAFFRCLELIAQQDGMSGMSRMTEATVRLTLAPVKHSYLVFIPSVPSIPGLEWNRIQEKNSLTTPLNYFWQLIIK